MSDGCWTLVILASWPGRPAPALAGRQSLEVLDPATPEAALTDAVMSANETLLTEGNLN